MAQAPEERQSQDGSATQGDLMTQMGGQGDEKQQETAETAEDRRHHKEGPVAASILVSCLLQSSKAPHHSISPRHLLSLT